MKHLAHVIANKHVVGLVYNDDEPIEQQRDSLPTAWEWLFDSIDGKISATANPVLAPLGADYKKVYKRVFKL